MVRRWPPPAQRIGWALLAQAAVYWGVLALLGTGAVSVWTWAALQGLLAVALVVLRLARTTRHWRAHIWLAIAIYAVFFAAFFAGANFALDALHGAQRLKAEVSVHLGGLDLWQFLCPGVFSLALGGLVAGWA
jgi:hypothetical protein